MIDHGLTVHYAANFVLGLTDLRNFNDCLSIVLIDIETDAIQPVVRGYDLFTFQNNFNVKSLHPVLVVKILYRVLTGIAQQFGPRGKFWWEFGVDAGVCATSNSNACIWGTEVALREILAGWEFNVEFIGGCLKPGLDAGFATLPVLFRTQTIVLIFQFEIVTHLARVPSEHVDRLFGWRCALAPSNNVCRSLRTVGHTLLQLVHPEATVVQAIGAHAVEICALFNSNFVTGTGLLEPSTGIADVKGFGALDTVSFTLVLGNAGGGFSVHRPGTALVLFASPSAFETSFAVLSSGTDVNGFLRTFIGVVCKR